MNLLRRYLVWLRKNYNFERRKYFIIFAIASLVFACVDFAIDFALPFGGYWNFLRSVFLIPSALSLFGLAYLVSIYLHNSQVHNNPLWTPYRSRFSVTWRRRIAAVLGACLFVLAYATSQTTGYTFTSSIIGTVVLSLMAFIRTTKSEANRELLGIPDSRDLTYDAEQRKLDRERAMKKRSKKNRSRE